jgi:hypothetical protein
MKLVLVCVHAETGKSSKIPDDVREKLTPYLENPTMAIQVVPPKVTAKQPYDIEIEQWL